MTLPLWVLRAALVGLGLAGWYATQAWIKRRAFPDGAVGDRVHAWTAPLNRYLWENPRRADALLVATSLVIDLLGLFLVGSAILGRASGRSSGSRSSSRCGRRARASARCRRPSG